MCQIFWLQSATIAVFAVLFAYLADSNIPQYIGSYPFGVQFNCFWSNFQLSVYLSWNWYASIRASNTIRMPIVKIMLYLHIMSYDLVIFVVEFLDDVIHINYAILFADNLIFWVAILWSNNGTNENGMWNMQRAWTKENNEQKNQRNSYTKLNIRGETRFN